MPVVRQAASEQRAHRDGPTLGRHGTASRVWRRGRAPWIDRTGRRDSTPTGTLVASIVMVFRGRRGSAGRLHLSRISAPEFGGRVSWASGGVRARLLRAGRLVAL